MAETMTQENMTLPYRGVGEWTLHSERDYAEPFIDVQVDAKFTAPSGAVYTMPGFYDGGSRWRVRFSPNETGSWLWRTTSAPANPDLDKEGAFEVMPRETAGFLKSTPDAGFGFSSEDGRPVFLLGDTVYNLFGLAHCGGEVETFMQRRAQQGFNILRVRLQVSPFHPPDGCSDWQTRSTWPWGGSAQSPRFDRFNLDWFHTVDRVVQAAERIGIGLEMIMEAWGFEYPFNNRTVFAAEWEMLWMRTLIARYDAYRSVYVWTLMNEYEFYPDGRPNHSALCDRWAIRMARWLKDLAPHGHVFAVHNTRHDPIFAKRFAADLYAIDAVMYQDWGSGGADDGWLTAGIENSIDRCFADWPGSVVFSEYGYERNPEMPITFPAFRHCDAEHNRRGAWRGAFCAVGVINGFENTWGPVMELEQDQEGVAYFQYLRRFFSEVVPFAGLRRAQALVLGEYARGHTPLVLANTARSRVAVYFPAGGEAALDLPSNVDYDIKWYNPRSGEIFPLDPGNAARCLQERDTQELILQSPGGEDAQGHAWDWVAVLSKA